MSKRLAVNPKIEPLAEEIAEAIGLENLSQLFTILLTRYGRHLKATWEYNPQAAERLPDMLQPEIKSTNDTLTPMSELL